MFLLKEKLCFVKKFKMVDSIWCFFSKNFMFFEFFDIYFLLLSITIYETYTNNKEITCMLSRQYPELSIYQKL